MDPGKPHELNASASVGTHDVVLKCPACHKDLVVDQRAKGHTLDCPLCGKPILVPEVHKVVTLSEAPETVALEAKPAWEQELISIHSALNEIKNQRAEAGNHYKSHVSEANRLKLRMEKLDEKLKELEARQAAIRSEHP